MTIVKFGDVAQKVLGNEDRLSTTREYYIGGEHFATGNLEIKQFGRIRDEDLGYQFHFPFESGDVLFMTKNPRLKKAGRVNISGICSIATFVIRTKSESRLLQDFLPILMQSDSFWEYLMANQSGSVNPFIKWGTLEKYCFDLPDISTQKQYCTIIWNLQELINELETQTALLDQLVKSRFIEMFGTIDNSHFKYTALEQLCYILDSQRIPITAKDRVPGPYPYYGANGVQDYVADYIFDDELILLAEDGGHFDEIGRIAYMISGKCWVNNHAHILKPKSGLNIYYLLHSLNMIDLSMEVNGTTRQKLTQTAMRRIKLPLPPVELQNQFADFVQQVDKSKFELQKHLDDTKRLQKALINQAFNPESVQD